MSSSAIEYMQRLISCGLANRKADKMGGEVLVFQGYIFKTTLKLWGNKQCKFVGKFSSYMTCFVSYLQVQSNLQGSC